MEAASRPQPKLTLSLATPPVAWAAFTQADRFRMLQSSVTDPRLMGETLAARVHRNANLTIGDLLLIWHDNGGGQGLCKTSGTQTHPPTAHANWSTPR